MARLAASLLVGLTVVSVSAESSLGPGRDRDPVELVGSSLTPLLGANPDHIVGFRYEPGWIQVPLQVDERVVVDFGAVYDTTDFGLTFLAYADAGTFTGADSDPDFDADDEIVFMSGEAGLQAPGAPGPAGTVPGSGLELQITDPVSGSTGYLYLFQSNGTLDPGAGADSIAYEFVLLSGDYKTTYGLRWGPNPENSTVATSAYSVHFSDRWIRDETAVLKDGAPGTDILDRHKNLFSPGNCSRSEDTFSAGEGAFIVNRTGPVRALRGYVGANSGVTTYRIHKFYEEREDILTVLRVHAISGVMDYFDYSPAASGMAYFNDLNPVGALIDGNPVGDSILPGPFVWELVTGAQGSLVMSVVQDTDIPLFDYSSYYSDDASPTVTQCTGDGSEYGASGFWEQDPVPNTDPALGTFNRLSVIRQIAFSGPNRTAAFAESTATQLTTPFDVIVEPYVPATTSLPGDPRLDPVDPKLVASPNPFRSELKLEFALSRSADVHLDLFDVQGRLLESWYLGRRPAGAQEHVQELSELAGGVYLLRMQAGFQVATVRLVHLD